MLKMDIINNTSSQYHEPEGSSNNEHNMNIWDIKYNKGSSMNAKQELEFPEIYYNIISDLKYLVLRNTNTTIASGEYIPKAHQFFPYIYLQSNPDQKILACDWAPGSGKTGGAGIVVKNDLDKNKRIEKVLQNSGVKYTLPKPFIIGPWASIRAFTMELSRPYYEIITEEEYKKLHSLPYAEAIEYQKILDKKIFENISITTPQKFFNDFFQGAVGLTNRTDVKILLKAIDENKIYINEEIKSSLNHSKLIVDEFHKLYSANGMNSYGFNIEYIMQSDIDVTLIALSGTFINSSISEIIHLLNIIRPKGTPRLKEEDYIDKKFYGTEDIVVYKVKPEKKNELLNMCLGKFSTYVNPPSKTFPILEDLGDVFKIFDEKIENLKLYRCHASKTQWKKHEELVFSEDIDTIYEQNRKDFYSLDLVIPDEDKWASLGVSKITGREDVYTGVFLKNKLAEYGAIPYYFVEEIKKLLKQGNCGKIAAYNRRVKGPGVFQYGEILKHNGMIFYTDSPREDTLCKNCGEIKKKHTKNTKHKFVPVRYSIFTGDMDDKQKDKTLYEYNHVENIYGDKIMIILFSNIAEVGISFRETNYLFYLCTVSSFTQKLQLRGRASREDSHIRLPPNKRFLKTYALVLSPPEELCKKGVVSEIEKRYYIKYKNHQEIADFWSYVQNSSISCRLFENVLGTHNIRCIFNEKIPDISKISKDGYEFIFSEFESQEIYRTIRYALKLKPIWELNELFETIKKSELEKSSWNLQYIRDESYINAIHIALANNDILIYDLEEKKYKSSGELNLENYLGTSKDNILILKYTEKDSSLLYSIFYTNDHKVELRYYPLTYFTSDKSLIDKFKEFGKVNGERNKIEFINSVIVYPSFIDYLKKDFIAKGDYYNFIKGLGMIVYKGDNHNNRKFVANRLSKKAEEIGFILGPYTFTMKDSKSWEKMFLPLKMKKTENEDEYVGIYSVGSSLSPGKWVPRFKIRKRLQVKDDLRNVEQGMACRSYDKASLDKIYKAITKNATPDKKEDACQILEETLIKKQANSDKRIIYTYYEMPVILAELAEKNVEEVIQEEETEKKEKKEKGKKKKEKEETEEPSEKETEKTGEEEVIIPQGIPDTEE